MQGGRGIGAIRAVATSKERNTAAAAAVAAAPEGRGRGAAPGRQGRRGPGRGRTGGEARGGGAPKDAYSKASTRQVHGGPARAGSKQNGGLGVRRPRGREADAAAGAGGAAKRRAVGRPGEDDEAGLPQDRERKKSAKQGSSWPPSRPRGSRRETNRWRAYTGGRRRTKTSRMPRRG